MIIKQEIVVVATVGNLIGMYVGDALEDSDDNTKMIVLVAMVVNLVITKQVVLLVAKQDFLNLTRLCRYSYQ